MPRVICNEFNDPLLKIAKESLSKSFQVFLILAKKRNENGIYQLLIKSNSKNIQVLLMKVARNNLMIKVHYPQTNKKGTLENRYKLLFFATNLALKMSKIH